MKDTASAVLAFAAFAYAGFRLYQKYIAKNTTDVSRNDGKFSSKQKEDEYEPYSKK